jgi:hypothetical protein
MSPDTPTGTTPPEKAAPQPRSPQDKRQAREIAAAGQIIRAVTADVAGDKAIALALAEGGYPLAEFKRADGLQEAAQSALAGQLAVGGGKDAANKTYAAAEKSLTTLYLNLRGLARSAFLKDRAALEKLGISGNAPRALADLLNAGENLVRNAPLALYADKLTKRGVTAAKLQNLQDRLAALQEADRVQETAKEALPPATAKRNASAQALTDWLVEFKAFAKVQFKDQPDLLKRWGLK